MRKFFQIGQFAFDVIYPPELVFPPNFLLFETERQESRCTYEISFADALSAPVGAEITRREDLLVYGTEGGEGRLIGVRGTGRYYARYEEVSPQRVRIVFRRDAAEDLVYDTVFTSLFALERHVLPLDELVLHCAYLRYEGEAILFSAPSETGKSTQANLWERYRKGSRTINGDKSLLYQENGRWMAHGWPVCGTSEVCHNLSTPIRAIVMLRQDKINHAERLSPMQAFSLIYPQITANRWNKTALQKTMDLIEALITQVPVWHLDCTISEEAVDVLYQALYPSPPLQTLENAGEQDAH